MRERPLLRVHEGLVVLAHVRVGLRLRAAVAAVHAEGRVQAAVRSALATAAFVVVGLPSVAWADEPAGKGPAIPEVRVVGDSADALQKVPGSRTVITPEQMKRADPVDVSEMLRRVPGVQARQDTAAGQRLDIGVRGLESGRSRRVLVLEDGIPIGVNPYAEPDLFYATPIERVRSIEVVKGSASILFGPQTLGGVINFVTFAPAERTEAMAEVKGGLFGYGRGVARYGDSIGSARYTTQASYQRGDGVRAEPFEAVDAFGKVALDTSDRGTAILKIGFHDDVADSGAVGLTREMFRADPRRTTLTPNDHHHLRRYEASLVHDQRFTANVKLRTLAYAYVTDRIWRRQNYLRTPTPGESYERIEGDVSLPQGAIYFQNTNVVLDRSYEVAGLEPRIEHRFETAGIEHTMDYGARLLGESAHYQQRTGEHPRSFAGTLDSEEEHRTLAAAAYVQDRMAFRKDLLVTPGLRVERATFRRRVLRASDATGANHDTPAPAAESATTGIIPGIGIVFGAPHAHVFGGLHLGWAPPRVAASISPNGTPADLGGEQSINYELGTRIRPARWLRTEATAFMSNFRNQIVLGPSVSGGPSLAAEGPTRHLGFETQATLEIARALGARDVIVDLTARYNLARATFHGGANDGNILPYAPLQTFSTNLDLEHRSGVGGQIAYNVVGPQYSDARNTVATDASGRVGRIDAWHIVDLTAHYRHKPSGISVRLTVKNALDDVYVVARRPEGIFASGFRMATLGVRWDYDRPPAP